MLLAAGGTWFRAFCTELWTLVLRSTPQTSAVGLPLKGIAMGHWQRFKDLRKL
jgi:hypothetical protein